MEKYLDDGDDEQLLKLITLKFRHLYTMEDFYGVLNSSAPK
jgi:hypothetical protein